MTIRKAIEKDLISCVEIAKRLSDWFDNEDLIKIRKAIYSLPVYVYDDGKILGFVCIKEKSNKVIELEYFAVDIDNHHKGIGTKIIKYVENKLAKDKIIVVKTLDDSSDYEPYARTRAFYEKNGFLKIDVVDPYPGWSEKCPCAIYIKT